ncbi:MAG: glycosyltransferase family 2 protein [Candidatus Omnitrophota bacterium]|nr:glycosyltransferase family 2 protein [Candidatus Omnitrophota bacterium]
MSSVTIIIPAYKEEGNIEAAIDSAVAAAQGAGTDYEIIVVDDGSPDRTGEFARLRAESNPGIRVALNATNEGFGYSFARGVKMASKDYVTVFPGDNDMAMSSLKDLIASRGSSDLVISYMQKTKHRSLFRRAVSRSFVGMMNMLFGLRLQYYNGAFICKTQLLRSIPIKSTGLAALAECLVRLLKKGTPYRTVYFEHAGRRHEQSKAFRFKSIRAVAKTIGILIKDIYFPPRDSA